MEASSELARTYLTPAKIIFGMNYAVWLLHAAPNASDKFYDFTGAASFVATVTYALVNSPTSGVRAIIVSAGGLTWALRLGSYLFRRILRDGTDRRQAMKGNALLFLIPFTIQALWTLSLTTPALFATRYGPAADAAAASSAASRANEANRAPMGSIDAVAVGTWLFGFAVQVVADRQKEAFAAAGLRETGFIHSGVWAHSRHPNYMGEILMWAATALLAYRDVSGSQRCPAPAAVAVAPIFTYLLLNYVSGVPLLERRAAKLWGSRVDYQRYILETPVLWGNPFSLILEILRS